MLQIADGLTNNSWTNPEQILGFHYDVNYLKESNSLRYPMFSKSQDTQERH